MTVRKTRGNIKVKNLILDDKYGYSSNLDKMLWEVSSSSVSSCFAGNKVSRKRDEELMAAKMAIFGGCNPGKNQSRSTVKGLNNKSNNLVPCKIIVL